MEGGQRDLLLKKIQEGFPYFVSKIYEDTTIEFIRDAIQNNELSTFYEFGRWWNKNTEIDLVGLNKYDDTILFVETKWNNQPIGINVFNKLKEKSKQVKWGSTLSSMFFLNVFFPSNTRAYAGIPPEMAKRENMFSNEASG